MTGFMASGRRQYPFHLIERKWQQHWKESQSFRAWNPGEKVPEGHPFSRRHRDALPGQVPKFYILDMFPYPSGAGLHVGHPEGYTATDILARYRRAQGYNVLHPMGWDAFGLPAEQYAIKTGQHPRKTTESNVANFRRQIESLGFSYDWSREVDTTDPGYFKWTQWIFLKLYNSWFNPAVNRAEPVQTLEYPSGCDEGTAIEIETKRRAYRDSKRLAYVTEAPVWWCEQLGTVLANEEVVDGKSEVGGFPVVRKPMRQWMLRITAYAERLLKGLDAIDWSDSLKEMQRNWIGRSEGAEVRFRVAGESNHESEGVPSPPGKYSITVFTTRPDTLFGATYMVLSPEHEFVRAWLEEGRVSSTWPDGIPLAWKGGGESPRAAVESYRQFAAKKSDLERTELAKEKTGVFTGVWAVNPVTGKEIPIWIADYVLISYGTGAIMAVPGHDTRDFEFAQKFDLPITQVVQPPAGKDWRGYVDDGTAVNSSNAEISIDGLPTTEAKKQLTVWLEAKGIGRGTVNYKLRDWLFSRQRYWGEPFPIVWKVDQEGMPYHEGLPESELPLLPPDLADFKPTPDGRPPLARAAQWVSLPGGASREVNTMPQWAGSCWYYLRYLDAGNTDSFCSPDAERYWMGASEADKSGDLVSRAGVDLYVGGTEHAVLHLLYARFWHKVLFDLGLVSTAEPFHKLVNQGLILGEDGQKMSKSRGNVINPDDILSEYGADAFRLYEMFMGPLEMVKPWNTKGVEGVYRFLGRVWRLFVDEQSETEFEQAETVAGRDRPELLEKIRLGMSVKDVEPAQFQLKALHACIKKVTEDLNGLRFNTAISALMVFINESTNWESKPAGILRVFLVLLQPFAPHLAEELWEKLDTAFAKHEVGLAYAPWPAYDAALLIEDIVELPVQVNGKLRDVIRMPAAATEADLETAAKASEKVQAFLKGKTIRKVIVLPGRLVNIVAN